MSVELEALRKEIAALRKTNAVLLRRVEQEVDQRGNDFTLFAQNILLQKHVDTRTRELSRRARLQEIIMEISCTFINLDLAKMDESIHRALEKLGRFVDADRVYIFDYCFEEDLCCNTHEWCAEGIEPQRQDLQAVPLFMVPDWVTRHRMGKTLYLPDVGALGPEQQGLREILEPQGIVSLIAVPLMRGEECLGFIGFDSVQKQHRYTAEERMLLEVFAQILVNLRGRRRTDEALQKSREDAEQANRAKSDFLANMSHEIRTPMNGVIGMLNLLLDTPMSAEQKEFTETALSSADALLDLLNDILDFSKMEAGKLELSKLTFDLRALLDSVAIPLALRAQQKNVELICAADPEVPDRLEGDPSRLRQILINLVGNAVKFTAHGEVAVLVEVERREEGRAVLRFSVRDTGIGIAKDKLPLLFEKFRQLDSSSTRQFGGSGLGLAIARQLAELMGGEIGVFSEAGKGSMFWITAGFGIDDSPSPYTERLTRQDVSGCRVLIVDDNATNRLVLRKQLQSWGIESMEAETGPEALLLLNRCAEEGSRLDGFILDMQMPGMDGITLALEISKLNLYGHLPRILLTSIGPRGLNERALEAGFTAWMSKPVRPAELFETLANVLVRKRQRGPDPTPAPVIKPSPTPPQKSGASPFEILLVEDNLVNQKVAAKLLEKHGYGVKLAVNGEEAIEALLRKSFDLVLMDVQMPVMDGFTASRLIRNPATGVLDPGIPIVAMTAHAMDGDKERCLQAGMNDYITKPISAARLLDALKRWIPETTADI